MAAGESQQMLAGESERLLAGRYRLLAVIGRGGMGAVWRARDELLNRDVAVKEIVWPAQLDAEERETARRRAVREAQLAARVRHPNVVGVYDIIEEGDRPSIVMELVPFRSLRDAVAEDGPMTPAEAARVGLSVLAALRAVHEAGVVHRDVKPANILLGPGGRVVLADFGIAKAADSPALTRSGVLLGSPSYLAPERARGGRAGAAADMWALGASLFAAVEGHPLVREAMRVFGFGSRNSSAFSSAEICAAPFKTFACPAGPQDRPGKRRTPVDSNVAQFAISRKLSTGTPTQHSRRKNSNRVAALL